MTDIRNVYYLDLVAWILVDKAQHLWREKIITLLKFKLHICQILVLFCVSAFLRNAEMKKNKLFYSWNKNSLVGDLFIYLFIGEEQIWNAWVL